MNFTVAVIWALVLILVFAGVIIGLNKLEEWVDRDEEEE